MFQVNKVLDVHLARVVFSDDWARLTAHGRGRIRCIAPPLRARELIWTLEARGARGVKSCRARAGCRAVARARGPWCGGEMYRSWDVAERKCSRYLSSH